MIKTLTAAAAMALVATSAMAYTIPAEMVIDEDGTLGTGLKVLAETGSGDVLAKEGRGTSVHGSLAMDYPEIALKAMTQLNNGEKLAPHYLRGWDGTFYVMVAPYGDVTDHFIRVKPAKTVIIPNSEHSVDSGVEDANIDGEDHMVGDSLIRKRDQRPAIIIAANDDGTFDIRVKETDSDGTQMHFHPEEVDRWDYSEDIAS